MISVILNSLLFIALLGGLCFALVRFKGGNPFLNIRKANWLRAANTAPDGIVIVQRSLLGWKSSMVDVAWQGRRYLVVVQEGRCTVVDRITAQTEPLDHV